LPQRQGGARLTNVRGGGGEKEKKGGGRRCFIFERSGRERGEQGARTREKRGITPERKKGKKKKHKGPFTTSFLSFPLFFSFSLGGESQRPASEAQEGRGEGGVLILLSHLVLIEKGEGKLRLPFGRKGGRRELVFFFIAAQGEGGGPRFRGGENSYSILGSI